MTTRSKFLAGVALALFSYLSCSAANASPVRSVFSLFFRSAAFSSETRFALQLSRAETENVRRAMGAFDTRRSLLTLEERSLRSLDDTALYGRLTSHDIEVIAKEIRPFTKDNVVGLGEAEAIVASETAKTELLKFSVLDSKLKIGKLKKFGDLAIEGGEINVYRTGTLGAAAGYCGATECYKAALRSIANEVVKAQELTELAGGIQKAKKPVKPMIIETIIDD